MDKEGKVLNIENAGEPTAEKAAAPKPEFNREQAGELGAERLSRAKESVLQFGRSLKDRFVGLLGKAGSVGGEMAKHLAASPEYAKHSIKLASWGIGRGVEKGQAAYAGAKEKAEDTFISVVDKGISAYESGKEAYQSGKETVALGIEAARTTGREIKTLGLGIYEDAVQGAKEGFGALEERAAGAWGKLTGRVDAAKAKVRGRILNIRSAAEARWREAQIRAAEGQLAQEHELAEEVKQRLSERLEKVKLAQARLQKLKEAEAAA